VFPVRVVVSTDSAAGMPSALSIVPSPRVADMYVYKITNSAKT